MFEFRSMKTRRSRNPIALLALAGAALGIGVTPFAKFEGEAGAGGEGAGGGGGNAGGTGNGGAGAAGGGDNAAAAKLLAEREAELARLNAEITDLRSKSTLTADERKELAKLKSDREAAERKRKEDEGQYQVIIKEKEEAHAAEIANLNKQRADAIERLCQERTRNSLNAIFPKYSDIPSDRLHGALFRDSVRIDENGVLTIKDPATGGHPKNEQAKPMNLDEYVKHVISNEPWAKRAKVTNGSGGGSSTGDSGSSEDVSETDIASMNDEQWAKYKKQAGLDKVGSR